MKLYSLLLAVVFYSQTSHAEQVLSLYGGIQTSPHSRVSGVDGNGESFNFLAEWEGRSLSAPPYYGIRYTKWGAENRGFSIDFSHSKVYASDDTLSESGFKTLEFTDGLNILSVNFLKRYSNKMYWGIGGGLTLPHVEVQTSSVPNETREYQMGGYALQAQIGIEKNISKRFAVFSEYKFNYTLNNMDLENGGELKTNIVTNAVNLGINYKF